ncbi:hypothetical protein ACJMK2_024563 [Sinanodonta woodiana]|uniref:Rab-GAP TBC domain-containing protein n=1 Tax=Sinanodonta woodiana TaxID=1069815 RepID=A0ABD3XDS0_SINWO
MCSTDESFEFIDVIPSSESMPSMEMLSINASQTIPVKESLSSPISNRTKPLTAQQFQEFLDKDGRLVDENALRKAIFLGGVEPDVRKEVWKFLFGLYPCSYTKRERGVLLLDYILKYHEMKSRWKTILVLSSKPGASPYEQGLIPKYLLDESQQGLKSFGLQYEYPISESTKHNLVSQAAQVTSGQPDFSSLATDYGDIDLNSNETRQQLEFMKIQAQVYVNRLKIDVNDMWDHIRIVDKDVPRTDRDYPYFAGPCNPHLGVLRDILITYATFHTEVGYAQGMNDILSRFLVVFDSEVEAYWCFHHYLDRIQHDFTEIGMVSKIELVRKLLHEMDPDLLDHLNQHNLADLLFCHRWLLLGFKREFNFMDSLRLFEILSSHHLELSSMEAKKVRHREQLKEFANVDGMSRTLPVESEAEYTFELFMCVALLKECRSSLMQCTDSADVFLCINGLKIDLDNILEKSEQLFFLYCKKTVEESFLIVESPQKSTSHKSSKHASGVR